MFVAPPVVELPRLPTLGGLPSWREYHGYQPSRLELSAAGKAVADLARFVDYRSMLGVAAPDPVRLATLLKNAIGWRTLLEELTAFTAYAKAGDGMAWAQAGKELAELKPLFARAVAAKPTLTEMYPALRDLFDAPRAAGKRSVVTRKANAAAKRTG
jgi:hypothetical protein